MKRVLLIVFLFQSPAVLPAFAADPAGEPRSAAALRTGPKQLVSFAGNADAPNEESASDQTISVRRLIGMRVVNPLDEDIGVVADLLVDRYGCPAGMVVRVGGFMGFGGEHVRLAIDKVHIQPDVDSGLMTVLVKETRQNMLSRQRHRNP